MSVFEGQSLLDKGGNEVDAVQALEGKVILVYFSAHWCPPCRQFTPVLKDFYEDLDGKPLAIVFVSSDRTEEDMKAYFEESHGDWYCAKLDSPMAKELKANCGVRGIPTLAVVNKEGKMLYNQARQDVQNTQPSKAFETFQNYSKQ